ncbi:MAG: NAD(P)/FAD-dependent oxidoreductase [Planctomycetota bacterium]
MPSATSIFDVVVVGAGAAGLFAAHAAAAAGSRVLVLEKNRKIGVKILISGGSRCNVTHDCSFREVAAAFGHAERFLLSALGQLTPQMVVELIERLGVSTYVEAHTGKVFPVSDRALDVREALHRRAVEAGAEFLCHCPLREMTKSEGLFQLVTDRQTFTARSVILTSGGLSYPGCGTTGDGYAWARHFGHQIVTPHPALTPLVSPAAWVHQLSGIALEDTVVTALGPHNVRLGSARTATLFTHFGLSGPAPMDVSRFVTLPAAEQATRVAIDLLPQISSGELVALWREHAQRNGKQILGNLPTGGLPGRLVEQVFAAHGATPQRRLAEVSKAEWESARQAIKECRVEISGTRGYEKAEVTAGGVELSEVNSRTLESRREPGLFFAGEILDLDGPIGGYNFQAAFSTGDLAGLSAARYARSQIAAAPD